MSRTRGVRLPDAGELDAAWATVGERLAPTPLLPALDGRIMLKLDTFQPTGSFKVRGALAALQALPDGVRAVTASAGNHGLGVAWAGVVTSRPVTVVVSRNASPAKVGRLAAMPVDLVQHGEGYEDAEAHALERADGEHAAFVSAYNDTMVIAGQATLPREAAGQLDDTGPLTVVVPVGGGGLAAGTVLWARRRRARGLPTRVVGVEAAASTAVSAAVAAGRTTTVDVGETLADGLAGNLEPGSVTPQALGPADATLLAVSEAEIAAAMAWLFAEHGLVVEGAGATGLAVVLSGAFVPDGTTVIALTGRNVTPETYARAQAAASPR